MTIERLPQKHYPKAEIGRRGMALGLDFLGVWLVSSLLGGGDIGIQFVANPSFCHILARFYGCWWYTTIKGKV